ncbi:hypothetical protein WR25_24543 [Diploscapter pachys]|uniref:Helicase C-terminal domain-containing protein n=1 Tax=Diploscapter pachys TaxID=2018661 RepID=A0A2A2KK75_9BILA|nr:hypothetical protein WR25_24543 [Diploscapter pachys]
MESEEFKTKYEIKDEEKLLKMQKRNRDAANKKKEVKKKKKGDGEDGRKEKYDERDGRDQGGEEEVDLLALQREKLNQVLQRFKLRGRGGMDSDLYQKMTERVAKQSKMKECSRRLLALMERGIGFHHQGMNYVEKGAVEVLFRSGHLAIIFSTSTLALGVNMPCKTVVFGVDTPYLTPLLYRQMSGRAGRRGFDHAGTVLFMSVPTSKMRRLLTASLSNLHGNPPFTASFLLRLLSFAHDSNEEVITLGARQNVARALLEKPFSQFTRIEAESGGLQKQLRAYVMFSVQFLRELQLLDNKCCAKNLANLAMHISAGEPGNLLFIYLLQKGVLHKMLKRIEDHLEKKMLVLQVLATIFTRERLSLAFDPNDPTTYTQDSKSKVFIPDLPEDIQKGVDEYNQMVFKLYSTCMQSIAPNYSLTDAQLCPSAKGCDVFGSTEWLVSPIFSGYSNDSVFLPALPIPQKDHRGRAIHMNAYAIDFFVHESRDLLHSVNQLQVNNMWFQLNDFATLLHRLSDGIDAMTRTQDPLALLIRELYIEYDLKFRSAFGMKVRD